MEFRILLASFALVFLAELGDKTQLTALAFTTSSRSPWAVFLGTSLALVAASAMAVLFGELLSRFLPVKILHISSGILFILMGLVLLVNIARKVEYEAAPTATGQKTAIAAASHLAEENHGAMFRLIINQAGAFEDSLITYLEKLSRQLPAGREKEMLLKIIAADRSHSEAIERMGSPARLSSVQTRPPMTCTDINRVWRQTRESATTAFEEYPLDPEQPVSPTNPRVRQIIETAVEAEEKIAEFYLALARIAKLHSFRDAFRALAMEDLEHAQLLCSLINPSDSIG